MPAILLIGTILVLAALSSKVLYKFGIPTLVAFLALGVIAGPEGLGIVKFENYNAAKQISDIALMFIMFTGGFSTNWKTAKPVACVSGLLATFGVVLTAALVGLAAHLLLGFGLLQGMLLGSIISSTDAAAIFSILRSKQLSLKGKLAALLEVESGSNDPMSYMLTVSMIAFLTSGSGNLAADLVLQLVVGVLAGAVLGKVAVWAVNHIKLDIDGLYVIVAIGVVMMTFSLTGLIMGNGLLAIYIAGIIMGNSKLVHKVSMVRFFDGLSWLMQILLFFSLGLIVSPSGMKGVAVEGLVIGLFIMLVARPVAVFLLSFPFKLSFKEKLLVSWVGFRGAASIVFATYPLTAGIAGASDMFNIVFFVILLSVLAQGTLLAPIARALGLTDKERTALRIFTDYAGDIHTELLELQVPSDSKYAGLPLMDVPLPDDVLVMMIRREGKVITPRGATVIEAGDKLLVAADDRKLLYDLDRAVRERTFDTSASNQSRRSGTPVESSGNGLTDVVELNFATEEGKMAVSVHASGTLVENEPDCDAVDLDMKSNEEDAVKK